jgi:4a-hydroxytetrahydrobiopterin dehydratase
MQNDLLKKVCVACEGKGIKPFTNGQAQEYLTQVPNWTLEWDNAPKPEQARFGARLRREFKFKDFIGAINFVDKVAELAEMEGHHPDIHIHFNKVMLELSTHAIGGLSENDFIIAAKVDAIK